MNLSSLVHLLWFQVWWTYPRRDGIAWVDVPYHGFNLFEGSMWVILAALVLRRSLRHCRSRVELAYALAFFTFGLTDFREAYVLSSWLLWVKGLNLLILLWLRAIVIRGSYPESKLY